MLVTAFQDQWQANLRKIWRKIQPIGADPRAYCLKRFEDKMPTILDATASSSWKVVLRPTVRQTPEP